MSVAAAIGIDIANAQARATIADGHTIAAGGLLTVSASTNTDANAKADASAVAKSSGGGSGGGGSGGGSGGSSVGIGAAVALTVANSTAQGRIGDDDVTAQGVKVEAVMTPVAVKAGVEKVHSFGAQATSGAGGGEIGVAGSVAISITDSKAEASIDNAASLALSGGELTLTAENLSNDLVTAKPAATPATSGSNVGVGASVALDVASDTTRAEIEDGARITGTAGEGAITATNAHNASIEAENGATSSGGTAVGAAVAIGVINNTTTAHFGLDDAATSADDMLTFTGGVKVGATHTANVSTLGHGDASGSTAVGVSVALNVIQDHTTSALDHSVHATGDVAVTASSVTDSKAESRASAGGAKKGGDNSQQELDSQNGFANSKSGQSNTTPSIQDNLNKGNDSSSSKTGAGSSSSLGVAAAIGVNVDISEAHASVHAGTKVEADGSVKVASTSDTDASALAIGTAVNITEQNSTAIGAAVAVNVATLSNKATVGDGAQITGNGITVQAVMPDDPAKQLTAKHEFSTRALAGAAGQETSVAGSVAVDVQISDTAATVGNNTKLTSTGGVNVDAVNRVVSQNIAGSGALSTSNTSVGASVVVNVITNTTTASIGDNATVDASGAMLVDATASIAPIDGDIPADPMSVAAGGAVSGDGAAIAGSVDVNIIGSTTHATLGNGIRVNQTVVGGADQSITVRATDDTRLTNAGGSLAGSLSSTGIGAGVEVDVITKSTQATIGTGAVIDGGGSMTIAAVSTENVLSVAGAIGIGDSVGVAAGADVLVITQSTDAHIGKSSDVQMGGAIGIGASDTQNITTIVGNAAGGGDVGVAGSVDVVVLNSDVKAYVEGGAGLATSVEAGGNFTVLAVDSATILMVAGGLAAGGSAGIGASNTTLVHNDSVLAYAGQDVDLASGGAIGLTIAALSSENIQAFAMGGGLAGSVGVAGSASVNVLTETTRAYLDAGVTVNAISATVGVDPGVNILASDAMTVLDAAGALSVGGSVGVGVSADVGVINKTTEAFIAAGASVDADGNVQVRALSTDHLTSIAPGGSVGGSVGISGSLGVQVFNSNTRAFVGNAARVDADGSVLVDAESSTDLDILAGTVSVGGSVGVGASASVPIINKTTEAFVDHNAIVNGRGNGAVVLAPTGEFTDGSTPESNYVTAPGASEGDLNGDGSSDLPSLGQNRRVNFARSEFHGVAVTAVNHDGVGSIGVSAGGGGSVAVNIGGSVHVINTTTSARVLQGAQINTDNTGASALQDVMVAAGDDYSHLGVAGALSIAGSVSVSPVRRC